MRKKTDELGWVLCYRRRDKPTTAALS